MRLTIITIVSMIALMFMMSGCAQYDFNQNASKSKIPLTVAKQGATENTAEEPQSADEFKKELEKLQAIIDAEKTAEPEQTAEPEVPVTEEKTAEEPTQTETKEGPTSKSGIPTITVNEGQLVSLNLKASDPEGDKVTYSFTDPLDDKGEWQTGYNDAGEYKVTVTASDGKLETKQDVLIIVKDVNRAPIISGAEDMTVQEGETVKLNPKTTDPDGGTVTLTYSGWMTTNTKEVGYDEQGMHTVTITATDNDGATAKKTITITIENVNRPPQIISITNG